VTTAVRRAGAGPSLAALILVTGISPLATDAYLPALPALQRSLSTSASMSQLTLTAFLVGLALGQLLIGPVSDATGRRPLLLWGSAAFAGVSLACAAAPNGPLLVGARLLEGLAAGGGVATGRAVVSDHFSGTEAAQRYGTLASVSLLAPVLAPPAGSLILAVGSWRTVFAVLAAVGLAMVAAVLARVPESLPRSQRQGGSLADTGRRVLDLLHDGPYMRHVVVQAFATMGFFTYIGGSSFALQTVYGIGEGRYALVFTVNAIAMVITSVGFRLLVARTGAARLRLTGLGLAGTAAAGLLVVALLGTGRVPWLAVPWGLLSLLTAGMGLMIPASTALAQEAGRRSGGTAAALSGGLIFLAGASVTPLTGVLGYGTLLPMGLLMTGFFALSALALAALDPRRAAGRRPRRAHRAGSAA
jgi:MFS transporter, DHA1 family, multidrug resistance protein